MKNWAIEHWKDIVMRLFLLCFQISLDSAIACEKGFESPRTDLQNVRRQS